MLPLTIVSIFGVVHAAFTHAQMRTLLSDQWIPTKYSRDAEGQVFRTKTDVFLACDEKDCLHYFFHVNHTLHCCGWGRRTESTRRLELVRLRRWHQDTFGFPLSADLQDEHDALLWEQSSG